ncbi:Hypothetical protein, putative, partial [Bodo saltans]
LAAIALNTALLATPSLVPRARPAHRLSLPTYAALVIHPALGAHVEHLRVSRVGPFAPVTTAPPTVVSVRLALGRSQVIVVLSTGVWAFNAPVGYPSFCYANGGSPRCYTTSITAPACRPNHLHRLRSLYQRVPVVCWYQRVRCNHHNANVSSYLPRCCPSNMHHLHLPVSVVRHNYQHWCVPTDDGGLLLKLHCRHGVPTAGMLQEQRVPVVPNDHVDWSVPAEQQHVLDDVYAVQVCVVQA